MGADPIDPDPIDATILIAHLGWCTDPGCGCYNYIMDAQFDVVVERDADGYYIATVPALPGCHTQAKSLDALMSRVREAITLCLDTQGGRPAQKLDFIGIQRVSIPT